MPYKNRREVAKHLRLIYEATDEQKSLDGFVQFESKWGSVYPYICTSWISNRDNLVPFLGYPMEIRKLIYTTNMIENVNRNLGKFTKNKTIFPDDSAVTKAVYLAVQHVSQLWTKHIINWPVAPRSSLSYIPNNVRSFYNHLHTLLDTTGDTGAFAIGAYAFMFGAHAFLIGVYAFAIGAHALHLGEETFYIRLEV